jgi:urease accessory protein
MILVERIIGSRLDPLLSGRLHELEHHGLVDILALPAAELDRRRFRAKSTGGESVAIAIPRDQKLFDGAVLMLDDHRALVVRVDTRHWLRLQPRSIADAVQLGYNAGNLHWRVQFQGEALLVALEAPADEYLERLAPLIAAHGVTSSVMSEE